jgi:hypothetical protein
MAMRTTPRARGGGPNRSARAPALPQLSASGSMEAPLAARPPSGGRGSRGSRPGSQLPKALMDPALLAQTVKQASDEANIARIDRDSALHARDSLMERLADETRKFDAERRKMERESAEKQAELDAALELARSAKGTIEAQTKDLKARVQELEAEKATREAEHEQTTSKLSSTVKRQKVVLNQLTGEFEESHTLLQEVSDKEKAGLKAEVSKLRKQLLEEMQNRSGAHEKLEGIKAEIKEHEARVDQMKLERDKAKFRGDELFREMDALKIELEAAKALQVREHAEADEREKVILERLPTLEKAASDSDAAREAMVARALEAEAALSEVLRENETVRYDVLGLKKERDSVLAELKAKQEEVRERTATAERLQTDLDEARALAGVATAKSAEATTKLQAELKQTKQELDLLTEKAELAETRVATLREQIREAKSAGDIAAAKALRDHEAEILSWQEKNVAALAESSLLQKETAAQKERIAELELELADHQNEVQTLKIETMDHHGKSQKATLEAVQHMNRKDVELLAVTSAMSSASDKLKDVLKVVETDRDKMQLERDGAYAEIATHELALEEARTQLEHEEERAAELDRLLKVQELQTEEKLDAARLANIAAMSALREELGNEARTKEEALYSLVLELSAKLQRVGVDDDDVTLSESITGAIIEVDEGPGVLLATLPPSEEGAEYTDDEYEKEELEAQPEPEAEPEPEPEVAPEAAPEPELTSQEASSSVPVGGPTAAVQEAELQACNVPELRTKAAEAGCDDAAIEEARDADDPKAALITLIVAATLEPEVHAEPEAEAEPVTEPAAEEPAAEPVVAEEGAEPAPEAAAEPEPEPERPVTPVTMV